MPELPTRTLGRTGVDVTVLGYGALELYGRPIRGRRGITRSEAESVLTALLSSGINYIDTAPDYGDSEAYLGEFVSRRRDQFFLASKCGCLIGAEERPQDLGDPSPAHRYDRENLLAGLHQSLRRLNTDHLDLLQLHMSPSRSILEQAGAIETLLEVKREGLVSYIGCSSQLPDIVDHIDMGDFDVLMIPYSGLDRELENVISLAAQAGAGTVIRGGIGGSAPRNQFRPKRLSWDESLDDLLEGASRVEFMLRFTMSHPDVDTTIVGTMLASELEANVATARKGPLPPDVYAEAKKRFARLGSEPVSPSS